MAHLQVFEIFLQHDSKDTADMSAHNHENHYHHGHVHAHSHCHHGHHHGHSHIPQDKKILVLSFALITLFMVVEFAGGWWFNSLALMADAGHMANDSFSLLLALVALHLSAQKQKYFALLNGLSLVFVAVMILWEAAKRWFSPAEMQALPMVAVACLGLLVNLVVAWLMLKSDRENLNIRAAYLHVLADLFGSVVAVVAGLCAYFFGWHWVDVVASTVLSFFVLKSGIAVCTQAWKAIRANEQNEQPEPAPEAH